MKTATTRIEALERCLGLAGDSGPITFRVVVRDGDVWRDALTNELAPGAEPFTVALGDHDLGAGVQSGGHQPT